MTTISHPLTNQAAVQPCFTDPSSPLKVREIELTQWRSSAETDGDQFQPEVRVQTTDLLGLGKPSPLNTCPKCPPQAAQVISVLVMNIDLSSCLLTAPGIAISEPSVSIQARFMNERRHTIEECWPATSAIEFSLADIEWGVACCASVYSLFVVLVKLARAGSFGTLLSKHSELRDTVRI